MNRQESEKNIDTEMSIFFLFISLFSFFFYVLKHPLFYITSSGINRSALLEIYMLDLIIYLAALIPYDLILLFLFYKSFFQKKKISDNMFMILFFPLFGFFSKSMFLPHVYINFNLVTILKHNSAFFIFLFAGVLVSLMQYILRKINERM